MVVFVPNSTSALGIWSCDLVQQPPKQFWSCDVDQLIVHFLTWQHGTGNILLNEFC